MARVKVIFHHTGSFLFNQFCLDKSVLLKPKIYYFRQLRLTRFDKLKTTSRLQGLLRIERGEGPESKVKLTMYNILEVVSSVRFLFWVETSQCVQIIVYRPI